MNLGLLTEWKSHRERLVTCGFSILVSGCTVWGVQILARTKATTKRDRLLRNRSRIFDQHARFLLQHDAGNKRVNDLLVPTRNLMPARPPYTLFCQMVQSHGNKSSASQRCKISARIGAIVFAILPPYAIRQTPFIRHNFKQTYLMFASYLMSSWCALMAARFIWRIN